MAPPNKKALEDPRYKLLVTEKKRIEAYLIKQKQKAKAPAALERGT
jgi:hypothetical protein